MVQLFTFVAYSQSNGQAEVVNWELVKGLKARLGRCGNIWVEELPSILWAYRSTPWEIMDMMPFRLVYGGEVVVSVEIRVMSARLENYDQENNDQKRRTELDLVTKRREEAVARLSAYKRRICQAYNKKVVPHSFQVGDLVWKKIQPIGEVGKLQPRWEGQYSIC